ncbi:hypothetical protein HELRODRAFT_88618, partial [Helobdella robusta]|uniref:ETS domain-containing protein n=1 Tax=Helobdella robusta TaxID=6412 RepID=T1G744_HELRO
TKHLWKFMCRLLKQSCGMGIDKVIQWENKELGIFRIVNSKKVAELWGQYKSSDRMNFEKLSRALRCVFNSFL